MSDPQNIQSTPAPIQVGSVLRSKREAAALTVEAVGEKLKLAPRQVQALECDNFSALPGNTFVRGFVRNYARLLEIDPQPLLDQLNILLPQERVQIAMPKVGDATALHTTVQNSSSGHPILLWLMVVLGLLGGAGGVFWYLQQPPAPVMAVSETSQIMQLPPVVASGTSASEAVAASPVASESSGIAASAAPTPPANALAASVPMVVLASATQSAVASKPDAMTASAENAVRIVTESNSWIGVVDADGKQLVSQLMTAGSERTVSGKAPLRVKIGNAPKTKLYYRGQQVDLLPYSKSDVATVELK